VNGAKIAGTKSIDTAAVTLEVAIRTLYMEDTREDSERWGQNTVPDFREYPGLCLNKFGILVDVVCGCVGCLQSKARGVVDQLLSFERGLIRGAGGSGDCEEVQRYFLEGQIAPGVAPVVPVHLRSTPEAIKAANIQEKALRRLRVRHTFGVVAP
jgi:hypothetical protein